MQNDVGDLSKAEAIAILAQFQEAADLLSSTVLSDRISLDEALMWRVIIALPMLRAEQGAEIAMRAVQGVDPDGDRRTLGVCWRFTTPRISWLSDDSIPTDLPLPLMIVPVAELLEDLTRRVVEHRAAAERLN